MEGKRTRSKIFYKSMEGVTAKKMSGKKSMRVKGGHQIMMSLRPKNVFGRNKILFF